MRPTQHVLRFDDPAARDIAAAGGKGANLSVLTAAGIPVPPGFIVTTTAYRAFVDDAAIADRVRGLVAAIYANNRDAIDSAAQMLAGAITARPLDAKLAGDLCAAYTDLGGELVAVRSSATSEDLDAASFAGQHLTVLNVRNEASLLAAVRQCWASLFTEQAIRYREQCGHDHLSCDMAVVVQRMVQSERSGVAFGVDPVTHDHSVIVIEAVRGLGDALVSGAVTPDMYVVDKATGTLRDRTLVEQRRELVYGESESLDQCAWREVSAVKRTRPKLNDEELARLAAVVKRVEAHYGAPQDIEWAEADGAFYVLQSRPVTTLQHAH